MLVCFLGGLRVVLQDLGLVQYSESPKKEEKNRLRKTKLYRIQFREYYDDDMKKTLEETLCS